MPNVRRRDIPSFAQLQKSITPLASGDGPERIPWIWYHRRTYTSGTDTTLTFFDATGVNTTTNMQAQGQIPAPMFFELHHIGVYFDIGSSDAIVAATFAAAGALNDIVNLSDGVATLTVAQKVYFQTPIWMLPPGAGPQGSVAIAGTYTATDEDMTESGSLGVPYLRNRVHLWGDIVIPHNQNFSLVMDWASAVTLDAGNTDIIVYLDGYLYRRVL